MKEVKEVKIDQNISEVLTLLYTTGGLLGELKKETGEYTEELRDICHHILQLWNLRKKFVSKNQQIPQFEMIKASVVDKQRIQWLD